MLMLEAYQVEKWQGDRLLFAIDQLQVAKGAKNRRVQFIGEKESLYEH
jgi:hypothetical protein